ncbi:MAG: hypothetical protein IPJ81_13170 [Chitinophagaceae bacterium]|nr:hypothetical protein [Chitinophagaceae bacterium]
MIFLKKILFTFCFIILIVATSNAQNDSSFKFIKIIKGNFTHFAVDNLDNIYLLTTGNQLKKINNNGDSAGIFNDVKRYGYPSSIDVNNPLKILLYYKNYSTVVVLDRFLNMRNTINFRKQNIFTVNAISTSYDNNIWLFDEQNLKLKKIDDEGKVLQETIDWRNLFDTVPSPAKIIDRDNLVYVYDTAKGFFIFDYYNSFKNRLLFYGWDNIEVNAKLIYGFKNNTLLTYQLNSLLLKEYPLPDFFGKYSSIKAINGKVYLLKDDGIYQYQIIK